MKIAVYVQQKYAKKAYKKECFNVRLWAGLSVIIDVLKRAGHEISYTSMFDVSRYHVILVSITSDIDWYPFIAERIQWEHGNYKVIVGGAGVLNVHPFLPYVDYFVLGRGESVIVDLINNLGSYQSTSVIASEQFNVNDHYYIKQATECYPHTVMLANGKEYTEGNIGCPHKCLFCSYTWHRKNLSGKFLYGDLWAKNKDVEVALLDIAKGREVNLNKLRTTAIDGLSERLRFTMNKPITRSILQDFLCTRGQQPKATGLKLYNIVGLPSETPEDWDEFVEDISIADAKCNAKAPQDTIILHNTPFRAMPATPLACAPMSYKDYRSTQVARLRGGRDYDKTFMFFRGKSMFGVCSSGCESLSSVILSVIALRGVEDDSDNIAKLSSYNKFWAANAATKQATLERYFDVSKLFGIFTPETLPTRYLRTYANVERMMR